MTTGRFRWAALSASSLAAALFAVAAQAADCPSGDVLKDGFVLEGAKVSSEVIRGDGPITRVTNRFPDQKQTMFLYRGLIELLTVARTSQTARHAFADLEELFPLEKGDRHDFPYLSLNADKIPGPLSVLELEVAGEEEIRLGECHYSVLVVKHSVKRGKDILTKWTELYSPELEMTLAKRYDEGTAKELVVSYKAIHPLVLR